MKVLIITSNKTDLSRFAAEFKVIDWKDANFALNINFADYDGLILDVDSLTKLRESQDEPVYVSNLEAQLSSAIVADIASRKNSFVVVVGNPSTKINNCSVAFLLGFDIEVKYLAGSNLLKNTSTKKYAGYWKKIVSYDYYIESITSCDYDSNLFRHRNVYVSDSIKNRSDYNIGCCVEIIEPYTGRSELGGRYCFCATIKRRNTGNL